MIVVVDTNVGVVANARDVPQASPECVAACARRLRDVVQQGAIAIDDGWLILNEYKDNLRSSGQPGAGDAFLKWVLTSRVNPERCHMVPLTPVPDSDGSFAEFPLADDLVGFDPEDRKFVAVALAHPSHPPVLEAVDPGWWRFRTALRRHRVRVEFLCREDIVDLSG
jgi:hypothetical protein